MQKDSESKNFNTDHLHSTHRPCLQSRLTRRCHLPIDLENCTKFPCIKIRDKTLWDPQVQKDSESKNFNTDHLHSTHRPCLQSRLTRRCHLPIDLENCTKFPCIKIRDKTLWDPQVQKDSESKNFNTDHLHSTHRPCLQSRLTRRCHLPIDLENCTKSPCIKIRGKTLWDPKVQKDSESENFNTEHLHSTHRPCLQSRLTRRCHLPIDLENCTKFPCIKIRDKTLLGPPSAKRFRIQKFQHGSPS